MVLFLEITNEMGHLQTIEFKWSSINILLWSTDWPFVVAYKWNINIETLN